MRDFNFFEHFEKKTQSSKGPRLSYTVVLIFVVLAAAIWPAFNFFRIYQLNNEAEDLRHTLETSPDFHRFDIVDAKEMELAEKREQLQQMEDAVALIDEMELIDENLFFTIATSMPEDTALNSMSMSGTSIQVNGIAQSKPAVAEFEYNLRKTQMFQNIFVPSMSQQEELWQFNLNFELKEVPAHEIDEA
ncbi:MAG: hypothetical protein D5S00_11110 [Tindallia sp. MSAO_Bac2]|nr:MAG: hypothetical protein D5S00_11110 [Tindallia sp. MSAO_Bac2]